MRAWRSVEGGSETGGAHVTAAVLATAIVACASVGILCVYDGGEDVPGATPESYTFFGDGVEGTAVVVGDSVEFDVSRGEDSVSAVLPLEDGVPAGDAVCQAAVVTSGGTALADVIPFEGGEAFVVAGAVVRYDVQVGGSAACGLPGDAEEALRLYGESLCSIAAGEAEGGSADVPGTALIGAVTEVSATPDTGMELNGWLIGGETVEGGGTLSFRPAGDTVVTPVFVAIVCTITATCDGGGTVSGGGERAYGSEFELTATSDSGYVFCGWYGDDGEVSADATFAGTVSGDASYEARFLPRDASFTVTLSSETAPCTVTVVPTATEAAASRSAVFADAFSGAELSSDGLDLYVSSGRAVTVTLTTTFVDGSEESEEETVVVDETVTRTYSWMYQTEESIGSDTNDASATITVEMTFGEYAANRLDGTCRNESGAMGDGAAALYERFLDYDGVLGSVCKELKKVTSGMSDRERAECVLKFAQSFGYVSDTINRSAEELEPFGGDEWWGHPAEILYEKAGDCEDHAILFAGIMLDMGYEVALCHAVLNTGSHHLAAGVAIDGVEDGKSFEADGKAYVYCEATCTGAADETSAFPIGESSARRITKAYALALPSRRGRRPWTPVFCRTRGSPRTWCTARGTCRPSPCR